MHSCLLNTCSHLFQTWERLRPLSQSQRRPDVISVRSFARNSSLLFFAPPQPDLIPWHQLSTFTFSIHDGSWAVTNRPDNWPPWRERASFSIAASLKGVSRGLSLGSQMISNKMARIRWDEAEWISRDGDVRVVRQETQGVQFFPPDLRAPTLDTEAVCENGFLWAAKPQNWFAGGEIAFSGAYCTTFHSPAEPRWQRKHTVNVGRVFWALFPFVFIRHPQIPSSVGVWGNGLEQWCQRYHGWERNAYFRLFFFYYSPLSARFVCFCWWVKVLLICPLAWKSSVRIIQCNNTGNRRGGKEKNTKKTGEWKAGEGRLSISLFGHRTKKK